MQPDDYPMLATGYLDGIGDQPIDEVRTMRATCVHAETGVSFARRLVQGRLDILVAEQERRRAGTPPEPGDLVARLPEILAEHGRAAGPGRLPQELEAPDPPDDVVDELEQLLPAGRLAALAELSDAELAELVARTRDLERRVSDRRRALFERIDALQAELTRRYRDGEASVESLLP